MRVVLAILLMAVGGGMAIAQESGGGGGIAIAAVVDDQLISTVDLNDRIELAMATAGLPDTPETRAHVTPQILRQLIDEKLQMEEAQRDNITVTDAKLHEGIARIERQNGKEAGSLEAFVESHHLSKLSLYAQVRAQVAWSEVVLKKVRPKIHISDSEVARYAQHPEGAHAPPGAAGSPAPKAEEVLISIIHLPVDAPANDANVHTLADKLTRDIRSGASFDAVASQFSSSATGNKAASSFWVDATQIDPAIAQALSKTTKGGITDPIHTPTGYQIVKLIDTRESQSAASVSPAAPAGGEARAELAFKQILMQLKPDAKPKEAELLLTLAKEVQQQPGKCEEKTMAGAGDLSDMDFRVTLTRALSSDLPEKLRDFLFKLKVGEASEPVITPQGIRLFMLCERIDLPPAKSGPGAADDEIRQAIYAEKLELEAQKYLRDLRRSAFIEIRMH